MSRSPDRSRSVPLLLPLLMIGLACAGRRASLPDGDDREDRSVAAAVLAADGAGPHLDVAPGAIQSFELLTGGLAAEHGEQAMGPSDAAATPRREEELVVVEATTVEVMDFRKTDVSSSLPGDASAPPLQDKRIQDMVFLMPGVAKKSARSTGRIGRADRTADAESLQASIGGGTSSEIGYRLNGQSINAEGGVVGGVIGGSVAAGHPVPELSTETYAHLAEPGFRRASDDPLSTFSIDVDTASYSNVRRFLEQGTVPPPGAVRIEEMLNYFRYDDPEPTGGEPFSVSAEVSECPWSADRRLVRIGLRGRTIDDADVPPRNLVFLVDVSGSMQSADKLPLVKAGLSLLAQRLRPEDTIGLVVYAGAAGVVLEPTSDRGAVLAALERLETGGSTHGSQGIRLAYEVCEAHLRKGAVNRVVLATDGDFNVGLTSEDELVRLIEAEREKGVFLTVLGFGTGNLGDSTMESLADHGNGNYAYVDSMDEAEKVLVREAGGTLVTIAKDVKIQVEWNPATVEAWRLVGYENRTLAAEDFNDDRKDAGEIGAGHAVTALYEIVPKGRRVPGASVDPLVYQETKLTADAASGDLCTLKLRYKEPEGTVSRLVDFTLSDDGGSIAEATDDFRFAAAVAEVGMLLRDSDHSGGASWPQAMSLLRGSVGADEHGDRAGFVKLVDVAARLAPQHEVARVGE